MADPETPRDLTSTVVRGVSLAGAGYVFAQALNLVVYVVLARLLTPEDFGDFAAATILVSLSLMVTESGLAAAVVQRRDRVEEAFSTAAFATLTTGFLFSLAALAASPLVGEFFDSSDVAALAAATSGMVFLRTSGAIPDALLQRRFSFLRRLVVEPAMVVGFGVAAIIAASADMGAWALVIGQYVGFAVDAGLSWILCRWRPRLREASVSMWRELVAYGRHVFVATAVLNLGELGANAIIGRFLGTASLGQFRYALRLGGTPFALLLAGAAYVLFPAFSRIAEDAERLRNAFMRSLRWVCVLAFPGGMVFLPLGVPMAVIVFGDVWRPAGEALAALCLFPAGGMLASVVSEALKAIGEPRYLTRMHLVTVLTTVALIVVLQPFGLTAATAGFSAGAVIGGAYALWIMNRVAEVPMPAMLAEVWPPALAAVIGAGALIPLELVVDAESHGVVGGAALLVGEMLVGGAIYLGVLRAVAPETFATMHGGARNLLTRVARFRGPDPDLPEPEPLDDTLAP